MRIGPLTIGLSAPSEARGLTTLGLRSDALVPEVVTKSSPALDLLTHWPSAQGWWPIVRESFAGAWQRSIRASVDDSCTHPTFWACLTLIAGDIAKLRVKLVRETADGICEEISNPAYSPVLRRPNHYQDRIQFYSYWILSKLMRGNTYALKERDARGVICALYLMDPTRVKPMVTPNGDVYYALQQDVLAGVTEAHVCVPASEIIHDRMFTLYHPLVGLSPIYACGHAAMQGLKIIHNATKLFENGSQPSGVLTAPAAISEAAAKRIQEHWDANFGGERNVGKVAVLGDGLKFESMAMSAVDSELIKQLQWGDEKICSTLHVPPYMVGVGTAPTYNNIEALNQQYYSQCLQILIESLELCLTEGLELKDSSYGIEFDLDGLLRMDSTQKMEAATKGVTGGIYSPNEARRLFNLPKVQGGGTPYLQRQNYSLAALDRRDTATPPPPLPPDTPDPAGLPAPKDFSTYVLKSFRAALLPEADQEAA